MTFRTVLLGAEQLKLNLTWGIFVYFGSDIAKGKPIKTPQERGGGRSALPLRSIVNP
jgi:hypothetical protein